MSGPTWMSMTMAALRLNVQPSRLREMVLQGQFPAEYVKKTGDRFIFHPHAVDPPIKQADPMSADLLRQIVTTTKALNALVRSLTDGGVPID